MNPKDYFKKFSTSAQKRYEALRAFYAEGLSAAEAAMTLGFTPGYFKKLRFEFIQKLQHRVDPFFVSARTGPKRRSTRDDVIEKIIALRKQNHSIVDIKSILDADDNKISINTIDKILKEAGFASLPKRTRRERIDVVLPSKLVAPRSETLELADEEFSTESAAGL